MATTKLKEKAIGSIVKIKENGVLVDYEIINQGLPNLQNHSYSLYNNKKTVTTATYDASCDGTWVMRYQRSSTCSYTYSASGSYLGGPAYFYINRTFWPSIDSDYKEIVKTVKIPYTTGENQTHMGADGLECNAFVLSAVECGYMSFGNYSNEESDFSMDGAYLDWVSNSIPRAESSADMAARLGHDPSAEKWLNAYILRSINYGSRTSNMCVNMDGEVAYSASSRTVGIRPVMILNSDTLIDDSGNIVFNSAPTKPNTISYPQPMGGSNLSINWSASTDIDGDAIHYILEHRIDSGEWTQIYSGSGLTYSEAINDSWSTYTARVKAVDVNGNESAYTTGVEQTVRHNAAPPTPSEISFTNPYFGGIVNISCTAVVDPDGDPVTYIFEKNYDNSSTWVEIGSVSTNTIKDTIPSDGLSTYNVRVKAKDNLGHESAYCTGGGRIVVKMPICYNITTNQSNTTQIRFIAPKDYDPADSYYVNGSFRTLYKTDGTDVEHGWVTGAPLVFNLGEDGISMYMDINDVGASKSITVGSLEVGSILKLKDLEGPDREYIIVHQGLPDSTLYDASCDGTWVLRKDIYADDIVWDSSNNDYGNSDVHTYLNTTFVNTLAAETKNAIKQVKIPYQNGTGSGGSISSGINGLSTNVFLLGGYEVGYSISDRSYFPIDGVKLSYFNSGIDTAANNKRIATFNGANTVWYLRSPNTLNTNSAWCVGAGGSPNNMSYNEIHGIRPAMVLYSSSTVTENEDGSYTLVSGGGSYEPTPIYNEIATFTYGQDSPTQNMIEYNGQIFIGTNNGYIIAIMSNNGDIAVLDSVSSSMIQDLTISDDKQYLIASATDRYELYYVDGLQRADSCSETSCVTADIRKRADSTEQYDVIMGGTQSGANNVAFGTIYDTLEGFGAPSNFRYEGGNIRRIRFFNNEISTYAPDPTETPEYNLIFSVQTSNVVTSFYNGQWYTFSGHTGFPQALCVSKNDEVYSGAGDGKVYKLSPDMQEQWSYTYGSVVRSIFVDDSDNVYVTGANGNVVKLDSDGNELWNFDVYGGVARSVVVDKDGYIYVGGDNNNIIKFQVTYSES